MKIVDRAVRCENYRFEGVCHYVLKKKSSLLSYKL